MPTGYPVWEDGGVCPGFHTPTWIKLHCTYCGEPFWRPKWWFKHREDAEVRFCGREHQHAWYHTPEGKAFLRESQFSNSIRWENTKFKFKWDLGD